MYQYSDRPLIQSTTKGNNIKHNQRIWMHPPLSKCFERTSNYRTHMLK